jgi:hypothetical protein
MMLKYVLYVWHHTVMNLNVLTQDFFWREANAHPPSEQ